MPWMLSLLLTSSRCSIRLTWWFNAYNQQFGIYACPDRNAPLFLDVAIIVDFIQGLARSMKEVSALRQQFTHFACQSLTMTSRLGDVRASFSLWCLNRWQIVSPMEMKVHNNPNMGNGSQTKPISTHCPLDCMTIIVLASCYWHNFSGFRPFQTEACRFCNITKFQFHLH